MTQRGVLALVGGGEFQTECAFDAELLEQSLDSKNAKRAEVLILPTASAYENPDKKVAQGIEYFANLGAEATALEIYSRRDIESVDASSINSATLIYLTDGSPMHLRSVFKNTELLENLKSAWQGGAVLVGAGAGGDVLCDYMVDARGGAFTVGLGFITQLSMIPRYDTWSEEKIHRTISLAPKELFVAGIPHQTALISEAGQPWAQMGLGRIDIFRDEEKITISDIPQL